MPIPPNRTKYYKRSRFTTRLPNDYLYDRSHFWLADLGDDIFKIGLTKFAIRMLGDLVEIDYEPLFGKAVRLGHIVGTIEGFKAVSDIYCVADGVLLERNEALDKIPSLLDSDPYDRGWLYKVRGVPGDNKLDATGYASHLDVAIDRILQHENDSKESSC